MRNERSLRTNRASAEAKQPIIHCSTKVTRLRTSQTSPGWVTSCVSPRRGPGMAPAWPRHPYSEDKQLSASGQTVRDAHNGNSGDVVRSVLLICSSSPIKGVSFFYILFHWVFFSVLFVIILSSKTKPDSGFFSPPQNLSETDKLGSIFGVVSGCTRKNFTSHSAVTEFTPKMMK